MKALEWKESYSVGVKAFDEQHKKLLSYLNTIRSIFNDPGQLDELGKLLSELEKYAKTHFKAEEDLFVKYGYYGLEQHAKEHRMYEQKVNEFRTRFKASDPNISLDMLEFLADWLTGHIQGSDHDYSRFLNNCGVF